MEYHKLFIDGEHVATFFDIRDARSCVGYLKREDQLYEIQTFDSSGKKTDATRGRLSPDPDIWRKYRKAYVAEGGGFVVSYSVLSCEDAVEIALGRIRSIITENAQDSLKSLLNPK